MRSKKKEKSNTFAPGPPTVETNVVNINRDETLEPISRADRDDDSKSDCVGLKIRSRCLKIGTWNVRSLNMDGKFENLTREADSLKTDILGLSEIRLIDEGKIVFEDFILYYSGSSIHQHGVGILLKKSVDKSVMGCWCVSERNILVKLKGAPFNISILQTYAPTLDHSDEEIEAYYEELQNALKVVKSDEVLIVMGDMNAKVGKGKDDYIVGQHGLGSRNERGDRLVQFCVQRDLCIMNTFFKHPERRTYTWKSPGDVHRNQIDYLMIRHRFKNSVVQCKTYPGADIGSDHNPVIAKIKVKLKKMQKASKKAPKVDIAKLKAQEIQSQYFIEVTNRYSVLFTDTKEDLCEEEAIENEYKCLKESIIHGNETAPKIEQKSKKPWMTEEILMLMDERKNAKIKNQKEYSKLHNKIKRKCKEAKESFLAEKCEKIEMLSKSNQSRDLHREVKELTGDKRSSKMRGNVRSKDGTLLFEKEQVLGRWNEYIGELFDDVRPEITEIQNQDGPPIINSEVEFALKNTSEGKAPGEDGIVTEMWKALGEFAVEKLTSLFNKIYSSGYIPDEMTRSVFITLPKKPKATECGDYRLISLMPHITKIFLRVILNRIKTRINIEVGEEQFGFRAGSGTREGIFCLNVLAQKHLEVNKDMYICFIDYAKAFDRVKHYELIECLQSIGIDGKDCRIIANLYWQQKAAIRIEEDLSEYTPIQRGVRQGCILSPLLFNLYTELIFRDFKELRGICIGGRNVNNLRYADDTALLADNSQHLQNLMNAAKEGSEVKGLSMNVRKTKTMVVSKSENATTNIFVENEILEQLDTFKYLGQLITPDAKNEKEIRARIAMAKGRFEKMYKLFESKQLSLKLKLRMINCYIYSILLYGCETWTLTKVLCDRLEACEMYFLRRMGKISWQQKVTNEQVLKKFGTKRKLLDTIKSRKMSFFGHIKRHNTIIKDILEGKVEGRRGRGRPRAAWPDNIRTWADCSLAECTRRARDRGLWRCTSRQPFHRKDGTSK